MRGLARRQLPARLLAIVLGVVLGWLSGWSSWGPKLAADALASSPEAIASSPAAGTVPGRSDQAPSEVCEGEDAEFEQACARLPSLIPPRVLIPADASTAERRAVDNTPAHITSAQRLARERGPPAP